jgi:hypothetical protein
VRWYELPDAFEPAQGCLQISYRDVEMVAFQSPPPVRPLPDKRSSELPLMSVLPRSTGEFPQNSIRRVAREHQ